jgi:hypothetical protein
MLFHCLFLRREEKRREEKRREEKRREISNVRFRKCNDSLLGRHFTSQGSSSGNKMVGWCVLDELEDVVLLSRQLLGWTEKKHDENYLLQTNDTHVSARQCTLDAKLCVLLLLQLPTWSCMPGCGFTPERQQKHSSHWFTIPTCSTVVLHVLFFCLESLNVNISYIQTYCYQLQKSHV